MHHLHAFPSLTTTPLPSSPSASNFTGDNETFSISHGKDYFAFFKRMGEVEYAVAKERKTKNVVGVGAGVLRQVPLDFKKQDELTQV